MIISSFIVSARLSTSTTTTAIATAMGGRLVVVRAR
jgi:hypothetical protein